MSFRPFHTALPLMSITLSAGCGREMDLDSEFLHATSASSVSDYGSAVPRVWDGSEAFPDIANQRPLGACQSFAMTALLEYVYHFRSGHVVDLSEKYMAYKLLEHFISADWDEDSQTYTRAPRLGNATDATLIDVVVRTGIAPATSYPWGDLATDQNRQIDVGAFDSAFSDNAPTLASPAEYRSRLDAAFLTPPPARFDFLALLPNLVAGGEDRFQIRTPLQFLDFLGVTKESFTMHINTELRPSLSNWTIEEASAVSHWFADQAQASGVSFLWKSNEELKVEIVENLNRRMVVNVAAEVWRGDWGDDVVFKGGGGHAMVIVGYQASGDSLHFKLRNSWGTGMNRAGSLTVPADTLLRNTYWITTLKL